VFGIELVRAIGPAKSAAQRVEDLPLDAARQVVGREVAPLDEQGLEIAGRRAGPALVVTAPFTPVPAAGTPAERRSLLREVTLAAIIAAAVLAVRFESRFLQPPPPRPVASDVFAAATLRDLRSALDLYRRERGSYPAKIEELVDDAWIAPDQIQLSGYMVQYLATRRGQDYRLSLIPDY